MNDKPKIMPHVLADMSRRLAASCTVLADELCNNRLTDTPAQHAVLDRVIGSVSLMNLTLDEFRDGYQRRLVAAMDAECREVDRRRASQRS